MVHWFEKSDKQHKIAGEKVTKISNKTNFFFKKKTRKSRQIACFFLFFSFLKVSLAKWVNLGFYKKNK